MKHNQFIKSKREIENDKCNRYIQSESDSDPEVSQVNLNSFNIRKYIEKVKYDSSTNVLEILEKVNHLSLLMNKYQSKPLDITISKAQSEINSCPIDISSDDILSSEGFDILLSSQLDE